MKRTIPGTKKAYRSSGHKFVIDRVAEKLDLPHAMVDDIYTKTMMSLYRFLKGYHIKTYILHFGKYFKFQMSMKELDKFSDHPEARKQTRYRNVRDYAKYKLKQIHEYRKERINKSRSK